MKPSDKKPSKGITRRDALKYSGLALGGLAFGGALIGPGTRRTYAKKHCPENACDYHEGDGKITQAYDYFGNLPPITPWGYKVEPSGKLSLTGTPLEKDEMRMGLGCLRQTLVGFSCWADLSIGRTCVCDGVLLLGCLVPLP